MRHVAIQRFALSVACAGFIGTAGVARAGGPLQPTFPDLTYAEIGTGELKLDLYLPSSAVPPYPCVVRIHGGGWAGGNRAPIGGLEQQLIEQGFAVASISYRLTSQEGQYGPGVPVTFPAQIHDVKGAVRWLRANADTYNLDPDRFGSYGTSAGGHLSALLGTSAGVAPLEGTVGGNLAFSSRVQAAADSFGPTDILMINLDVTTPPGSAIDHDAPTSPESRLVGWDEPGQGIGDIRENIANPNPPYPALVQLCRLANPVLAVTSDDPPFYIAHGTNDTAVPIHQSVRLADALAAIGHEYTFRPVEGAGHGPLGVDVANETIAFFHRHLHAPGDLAEPYGQVDAFDLFLLLDNWNADGPGADLAPPLDVVDVFDLFVLLDNWG